MRIGKLSFGKRAFKTKDFKWFYCPVSPKEKYFYFFWWFGHEFYIALNK